MERTLRDYQWDALLNLSAYAADGETSLLLSAPTGSGKTLILLAFLAKNKKQFTGTVIAAPSLTTRDNFYPYRENITELVMVGRPQRRKGTSSLAKFKVPSDLLLHPQDASQDHREDFDAITGPGRCEPSTFLTTHQQLALWGGDSLPEDLSNKLLILDEAHRSGTNPTDEKLNTKIGEFALAWRARGGTVLYTTATPYRPDGQRVCPEDTKQHVWTISCHSQSGYAPKSFQVKTVTVNSTANTVNEFAGEELSKSENNRGIAPKDMVAQWIEDGRPKAVFVVPSKRSRRWTKRLIEVLKAKSPGVRIHNAVGVGRSIAEKLNAVLDAEREVTRYEDSQVDVIIACKRFDEGTDWPLCSHLYNYGIPSSFGLILQRWGRTFRMKNPDPVTGLGGIGGHPYPDTARITFFVPKVKAEVIEQFEKQSHHHAFLLATYMSDWERAVDISTELRIRFEKHWKRRPTNPDEKDERKEVEEIREEQELQVDEKVRAEMSSKITRWALQFEKSTGRPPTIGEAEAYLDTLDLTEEKHLAGMIAIVDELAEAQPEHVNDTINDLLGVMGEHPIKAEYRKVFESIVAEYRDQTFQVNERTLAIYSHFTGQDAEEVASRLAHSFSKPDLTEGMIVEAAKRHHERTGSWPTNRTGDATEDFGYPESWKAVNACLVGGCRKLEGGSSVAKLLHARGLKKNLHHDVEYGPPLTEDMIVEAARKHHERTGSWPTHRSGDATEDFGYPESWSCVNDALRGGGRNLEIKSSLAKLLHRENLKPNRLNRPPLTEDMIVEAAKKHHERTGSWPTNRTGDATEDFGYPESWKAVDHALRGTRNPSRSLPGGSSLAMLLHNRQLNPHSGIRPPLNPDMIINSAHKHYYRTGKWPTSVSCGATEDFGYPESWKAVDHALRKPARGLKGHRTLSQLLHDRGLKKNHMSKTPFIPLEDR